MKTILFILSFLGITALSTAQMIHVPADQPTIQAGIDAAKNASMHCVGIGKEENLTGADIIVTGLDKITFSRIVEKLK